MTQGVILRARPPSFLGGFAAVPSFPQRTQIYSSLDEKMPRLLRGHGMTQGVILRARPPSWHDAGISFMHSQRNTTYDTAIVHFSFPKE